MRSLEIKTDSTGVESTLECGAEMHSLRERILNSEGISVFMFSLSRECLISGISKTACFFCSFSQCCIFGGSAQIVFGADRRHLRSWQRFWRSRQLLRIWRTWLRFLMRFQSSVNVVRDSVIFPKRLLKSSSLRFNNPFFPSLLSRSKNFFKHNKVSNADTICWFFAALRSPRRLEDL